MKKVLLISLKALSILLKKLYRIHLYISIEMTIVMLRVVLLFIFVRFLRPKVISKDIVCFDLLYIARL